jgi:hypothetical protein
MVILMYVEFKVAFKVEQYDVAFKVEQYNFAFKVELDSFCYLFFRCVYNKSLWNVVGSSLWSQQIPSLARQACYSDLVCLSGEAHFGAVQ